MTIKNRWLILPLLAFAGFATAAEPIILQPAQIKALGIETAVVGKTTGGRGNTLAASVLVPVDQMRLVAAPVAGMVQRLSVAPGDSVKRGQVVAYLASPQALELQRDALQAGAQANLAQQALKRDEQLFAEGLIPESRLQASRANAAQAGALASERRQGLALAGGTAGQLGGPLALTAPIDGVVLEQGAQLGQRVEGAALIYRIAKLTPLWLEIQAPINIAAGLKPGMPVKLANGQGSGKLIGLGRAVDAASQTVMLRAEITSGADLLRPGQVVEVELPTATGQLPQLPASALARHQKATIVFVQSADVGPELRFEARTVKVVSEGGNTAVVEGLKAGERVAIGGVSGLKAMLAGVGQE